MCSLCRESMLDDVATLVKLLNCTCQAISYEELIMNPNHVRVTAWLHIAGWEHTAGHGTNTDK